LVPVPLSIVPTDLRIACLEIPDLPPHWRDYPAPPELAGLETKWALANDSLLLRVPSAVVEDEYNILINPMHPHTRHVTISHVEPYTFDKRLIG
jgi:RES domain-containing protein